MATEKMMETAGEITDIKAFASAIKRSLELEYPDSDVEIHEVPKNNSQMWTGIVIRGKGRNIAPTVYLEELFKMYRNGKPLDEIFLLCGLSDGEGFCSLSPAQQAEFQRLFASPGEFMILGTDHICTSFTEFSETAGRLWSSMASGESLS